MKTNKMSARYTNVKCNDVAFTAIDALDNNKPVIIDKSVSNIFIREEKKGTIAFTALTYKDLPKLTLIEEFIKGEKYISPYEAEILSKIYIRFGWLDKTLSQLQWVPLSIMVTKFVNKQLEGSEKTKFMGICKLLSLSLRTAREHHRVGDNEYSPMAVLSRKDEYSNVEERVGLTKPVNTGEVVATEIV